MCFNGTGVMKICLLTVDDFILLFIYEPQPVGWYHEHFVRIEPLRLPNETEILDNRRNHSNLGVMS